MVKFLTKSIRLAWFRNHKTILLKLGVVVPLCLLLGFIIWRIATLPQPEILETRSNIGPKVEINNSMLTGWDSGKKIWQIHGKKVWFNQDKNIAYFEQVTDGVLFNKQKAIILNSMHGQSGRAELSSGKFWVMGDASGVYLNKKAKKLAISARQLSYANETLELQDSIIQVKNIMITAPLMTVSSSSNFAICSQGVSGNIDNNQIQADYLEYDLDEHNIILSGNLSIQRPADNIKGINARYTDNKLEINNQVQIEIYQVAKQIPPKFQQNLTEQRTRQILKQAAILKGDNFVSDLKSKKSVIKGNAQFLQGKKIARAETMIYDEKSGRIILKDKVYLLEGQEWIKGSQLIINLQDPEFVVTGNVEVRVMVEI